MKFKISPGFLLSIVSIMLIYCPQKLSAQGKGALHGIVLDSMDKKPLELATVAVVNAQDTSLIAYTISDNHGLFSLAGLPAGRPIRLVISYVGYKTVRKVLNLQVRQDLDLGKVLLGATELKEVVIRGTRSPVVIRKDTIEFNTEAFKTRPNAVVEELLKKLPGIQVNHDGSLLVHGRPVSRLLIDGRAFFGNDPTVATRNLDAELVDKVQVYDDREHDPDHKLGETEVEKVINLKLKKSIKKSTIGKVYAGGGTRGRYEGGGILSNFRDTLQVSLVGLGNNLNGTKLSFDDLNSMGGFDRSAGRQAYDGTLGRSYEDMNRVEGIETVKAGGFNINNDYGNILKINLVYFYTNKVVNDQHKNRKDQILPDSVSLTSIMNNNAITTTAKHALGASVAWNPDSLNSFRYEPSGAFIAIHSKNSQNGNTYRDMSELLSLSTGEERNTGSNNSFAHEFSWHRELKKNGESLNISHSLSLNANETKNYTFNDLHSFTADLSSTLFDRYASIRSNENTGSLIVDYNHPFTKRLTGDITSSSGFNRSSYNLSTYDKNVATGNYDLFLQDQSNILNRSINNTSLKSQLTYWVSTHYRVILGVNSQWKSIHDNFLTAANVNHLYYNLLPSAVVELHTLRVSYDEKISQPGIMQIQPNTIVYSQQYKVTGNPDLQPTHDHNVGISFSKYSLSTQSNLMIYGFVDFPQNNVTQNFTIDANGNTALTYVNRNGAIDGRFTVAYNRNFKKVTSWQNSIDITFYTTPARSSFLLNGVEGVQTSSLYSMAGSASFNYKEMLNLTTQYDFTTMATDYKKVNYPGVRTTTQALNSSISLNWPRRIIFDANYDFKYNPQVADGFRKETGILNFAVSVQIQKKDRGQLKFSAYDLLNQNVSVLRNAANNAVTLNEQQLLKRYFLLTYLYKFSVNR